MIYQFHLQISKVILWHFFLTIFATTFSLAQNLQPNFLTGGDMKGFSLREDEKVGSVVYILRGSDPEKEKVTFSISGDYLSVDRDTGVVRLVKALDRETTSSIETIITVSDTALFNGGESNTVPRRFEIPILDVNDNPPIFVGSPYAFRVSESVSVGATLYSDIVVTDADAGKNSEIKISCVDDEKSNSCDVFEVREAKTSEGEYIGVISLKSPLDYEETTRYVLKLKAEDGGGLSSTTWVEITLEDVQDHEPVFFNAPYSASVAESTPEGTFVLEIIARDGDLGNPQPILLSIEDDDKGYFMLSDIVQSESSIARANLMTSSRQLDREDADILKNGGIYYFHVKAQEKSGRKEIARSRVAVVVTDIDDEKAKFSLSHTTVQVPEAISDGAALPGLNLIVSDEDLGENSKFALHLENFETFQNLSLNSENVESSVPLPTEIFEVFPSQAFGRTPVLIKIKDSSALDFENERSREFNFKIVATQNSNKVSTCLVKVLVLDSNDNSPVFDFPFYEFTVLENSEPLTLVGQIKARDLDSKNYGKITYSIKGFGAEKFFVNSSTGAIFVANCSQSYCLDFEIQELYSLTFEAVDGGGLLSSVAVSIRIENVNDNQPVFEKFEYRRTVEEGTEFFDPPFYVKASDVDEKEVNAISYAIKSGNTPDKAFIIDSSTGKLLIRRPLTHIDTISSIYTLTVRATDSGSPPLWSDVRVLITVGRDQNRAPKFTTQNYYVKLKESSPPGTEVLSVKARDPDGEDTSIRYYFNSGADGADHFEIDSKSGQITVSKNGILDRDVKDSYKIEVVAVDGGIISKRQISTKKLGSTKQSSTTMIHITLEDINNKPPVFEKDSYTGHVNERSSKGHTVLMVKARDPDTNPKLEYLIVGPIVARDKTGVILTSNSKYDYRNAFKMNSSTGEVFVSGELNHNSAAVIVFKVKVMDLNSEQPRHSHVDFKTQSATTEVTIYIQVFSAKNPIFSSPWTPEHPVLNFQVKEGGVMGQVVFSVAANDPITGRLVRRYEKTSSSDPRNIFYVEPISGNVKLNKVLDYENSKMKEESFEVVAIAGDRTSQATVKVEILDVNDHQPLFTEPSYYVKLNEASKWPQIVTIVTATDRDTGDGGIINYRLSGVAKDLFTINRTNGVIQVAKGAVLDREKTTSINLEVISYDTPKGGLYQNSASTVLKIDLIDSNDEKPVFIFDSSAPEQAVIPENSPIGTVVTKIKAVDTDLGQNGVVSYQIPEFQSIDKYFEIGSETGVIKVKSVLNGKGRSEPYELTIRALDQGDPQQFSEAIVILYIGDVSVNDGVPEFERPKLNEVATVLENSPIGTVVFQIRATDSDSAESANGKLMYSFLDQSLSEGPFQIDSSSGFITTKGVLDRETTPEYNLVIIAKDMGRPPQIASRVLKVKLADAEDNTPRFKKVPGKEGVWLFVEEEAAFGTLVGTVKAQDPDVGPNANIEYKIVSGNEQNLFSIQRNVENEGEIFVNGRIDREKIAKAELVVICGKLGQHLPDFVQYDPLNPSMLKVLINVMDLDDNRPEFNVTEYTAGVKVTAPIQSKILTLSAVDKDPTSLPIKYSIFNGTIGKLNENNIPILEEPINGSDYFLLEESTGVLRTSTLLKLISGDVFTLHVSASSNLKDQPVYTKVKIFILRDSELLRFVFDKKPREVLLNTANFVNRIQEAISVHAPLNVYDAKYYDDRDGIVHYEKTGSCFQLIGQSISETQKILNVSKNHELKSIYEEFGVTNVEPCRPRRNGKSIEWVEIWVLIIAAFVGLGALIASCAVCCLYNCYKQKIKRNFSSMRLLESPKLAGSLANMYPGSIVMLPPPQSVVGGPELNPMSGRYEWQELSTPPMDNLSASNVDRR